MVTLDTKAAAEGPSPGEGTAGIIPLGQEGRAEAEGQGRSALGTHDMELLERAEGLFLAPPSPPARNLRRTLGDPGTGLMVTWSNGQLMASVPGAGAGGGKRGLRTSHPLMWQHSLHVSVVSCARGSCAQVKREEMPAETGQGK